MSEKSKEEIRSEYEKDYLERLAKQGKIKSEQQTEPEISEEERTRKVEEAEKWITQKYPSAFLNPTKILQMNDAREIFLKRRLQRKLNQTSTTCKPIIPHTDFPKKEKKPSPPRTFVWENYLC